MPRRRSTARPKKQPKKTAKKSGLRKIPVRAVGSSRTSSVRSVQPARVVAKFKRRWPGTGALAVLSVMVAAGIMGTGPLMARLGGVNNLLKLEIRAEGDLRMAPGGTTRLSAEGYYGTAAVPVLARWSLIGTSGELRNCNMSENGESKTCEFLGVSGGEASVEAEAGGRSDRVSITVVGGDRVTRFTDEIPTWANDAVASLSSRNIILGYEDGRYGPADPLTRGQFVTLLHRLMVSLDLLESESCGEPYVDVPQGHFAAEALCAFKDHGWSSGLSVFGVGEAVTRSEAAEFVSRAVGRALLDAKGTTLATIAARGERFPDVPLNHRAFVDIALTAETAVMTGNPDGTFAPGRTLNRAEAALLLDRVLRALE